MCFQKGEGKKKGRFQGIPNGFLPGIHCSLSLYCVFLRQPSVVLSVSFCDLDGRPKHRDSTKPSLWVLTFMPPDNSAIHWNRIHSLRMVDKAYCEHCRDLHDRKSLWPRCKGNPNCVWPHYMSQCLVHKMTLFIAALRIPGHKYSLLLSISVWRWTLWICISIYILFTMLVWIGLVDIRSNITCIGYNNSSGVVYAVWNKSLGGGVCVSGQGLPCVCVCEFEALWI